MLFCFKRGHLLKASAGRCRLGNIAMDASFSGRSSDPSSSRAVWKEFQQLLEKSSHAFNRLRDIPAYGGYNWEEHFHKAFHVYSQLWKFQQDHRCEPPVGRSTPACCCGGTRCSRTAGCHAASAARGDTAGLRAWVTSGCTLIHQGLYIRGYD
jgi:hypothetical protein